MKHSNTMIMNDPPPGLIGWSEMTEGLPFNPTFKGELEGALFASTSDTEEHCAEIHRRCTAPLALTPELRKALQK